MSKYTIIIATAVLTFLYVGLVMWLHYGSAADASIGQYVVNNNLNSVGDFLAGLFSPLAFLWLIATVLIQSNELSLQRDELAENRAVMGKQAEAAEKQAQFLDAQTTAMNQQVTLQREAANEAHKVSLFVTRFELFKYFEITQFTYVNMGVEELDHHIFQMAKIEFIFGESIFAAAYPSMGKYVDCFELMRTFLIRCKIDTWQAWKDRVSEDCLHPNGMSNLGEDKIADTDKIYRALNNAEALFRNSDVLGMMRKAMRIKTEIG
ncbi:hypothetical protein AB3G45_19705 [Shinella sp. S4-D37]|uniref:hypothetical protein n=1 Tax=Shinella sp. S4-D37 TaxID=3161999 RepID=UPI003465AB29